jgi:hypothetical protein
VGILTTGLARLRKASKLGHNCGVPSSSFDDGDTHDGCPLTSRNGKMATLAGVGALVLLKGGTGSFKSARQ